MNFIQALIAAIAAAVSPHPSIADEVPAVRMPTPPALSQTVIMPKTAEEFFIRGLERNHAGDYYFAIADFTRAIERSPNQARYYLLRSLAYRQVDEEQKALVDINTALKIEPGNHQAMAVRGFIFMSLGRFAEARLNFNQAIYLNPRAEYYFSRGLLNKYENKTEEANADFHAAAQAYKLKGDTRKYKESMEMVSSR